MKKRNLWILVLCALLLTLSLAALAVPGDVTLYEAGGEDQQHVYSIAALEDTLYLQLPDGVYAYRPTEGGEPVLVFKAAEEQPLTYNYTLVSDGEALYLLSLVEETMSIFVDGQWSDPSTVDFSALAQMDTDFSALQQAVLQQDALYLLVHDYANATGFSGTVLHRVPRDGVARS